MEAVLGALLLDQGFSKARKQTLALFQEMLSPLPSETTRDHKSVLQEKVQAEGKTAPVYRTVGGEGGNHTRTFRIEVVVEGEVLATGAGASKRKAEQEAAKAAYARLAGSDGAPGPG